ncbi:MAG TPA: hypothetical protein VHE34_29850 [Puia sp.]|uniref:hypothetical protein n=1 Tax=Puia sp. TaxID=2045100 RepID=UPI002C8C41F1|nr:hypothetical protein [Puia sp.]HVU99476.1 hypothetical protein [Puia sp.]
MKTVSNGWEPANPSPAKKSAPALGYVRWIVKTHPGLVIDNNGFTDYSSGLAAGYIPWTDATTVPPSVIRAITSITPTFSIPPTGAIFAEHKKSNA